MINNRKTLPVIKFVVASLCTIFVAGAEFNYAKALQMGIYFYECQESGRLSTNNRVSWRGPAHTHDGADVDLDLSGGWYDAGDHWKSNNTMARSAMLLAWSMIEFPDAYKSSFQDDELKNGLKYICDYFLRCIVDKNPESLHDFSEYEIYVDVGGRPGPKPGVHSGWGSPEAMEGYAVREAVKCDTVVPGSDVAGHMAAALCASALVFSLHGEIQMEEYADTLFRTGKKCAVYARNYLDKFIEINDKGEELVIDPDGDHREIDYRDYFAYPNVILGLTWANRACREMTPGECDGSLFTMAAAVESTMYEAPNSANYYKWWRSVKSKYGMLHLLMNEAANDSLLSDAARQRLYDAVESTSRIWRETNPDDPNGVVTSPGGLHYRKNRADAFTIGVMSYPTALGMLFTVYDSSEKQQYCDYVKSQVDYILGDNPYQRSYMIGYSDSENNGYWQTVHHRGAYGAWASHDHFLYEENGPLYPMIYRPDSCRHVLYGGVLAGPHAPNDSFPNWVMDYETSEVALYWNAQVMVMLSGLLDNDYGTGDVLSDSEFPQPESRRLTNDLYTTDREFFVSAELLQQTDDFVKIRTYLHNRTRWPARRTGGLSFRYYLSVEPGTDTADFGASIVESNVEAEITPVHWIDETDGYIEVSFPGDTIQPFKKWDDINWNNKRKATIRLENINNGDFDIANDFSGDSLIMGEERLLPRLPVYHNGELAGGIQLGDVVGIKGEKPEIDYQKRLSSGRISVQSGARSLVLYNPNAISVQWNLHNFSGRVLNQGRLLAGESVRIARNSAQVNIIRFMDGSRCWSIKIAECIE